MQVVYSGGSTPSPSPHLQRKTGYGRPTVPVYMAHVHPQILVQRSRQKLTEGDITLRDSIPGMSKSTAIICLLMNIILPGSGTLTAGLSVLCCSHVRPKGDSKCHCIWVNAGVALLQFSLTFLFLLGWIWSIMWGVAFLTVSKKYLDQNEDKDCRDPEKASKQIQRKLKQVSDASAGGNRSPSKKSHSKHQCPHVNRHHEQCHHYHEHTRRHASKEHSPDPDSYNISDSTITTPSSPDVYILKHNSITNTNGFSPVPEMYRLEPIQLPRPTTLQIPQTLESYSIFTESNDTETAPKGKTGRVSLSQPKVSDNDNSWRQLHHQHFQTLTSYDSSTPTK